MRALVIVCVLCATAIADDRPWAKGVSADNQTAALALYDEGNKSFDDGDYKAALEKYEAALVKWQHPTIYLNAAICLYNLEQYLKAADYLEKTTAFGDAPFDKKTLKQIKDYKTLVSAHVTELEVTCKQTDVKITLDGEVLMTKCPANETRRVQVETSHAIVGEKPGYETQKIGPIFLGPGEKKTFEIELKPSGKGKLVRRWNKALPWSVIGAGVVTAVVGGLEIHAGNALVKSYNYDFGEYCKMGCVLDPSITARVDNGHTKFDIGEGLMIAGGVVAAAGIAMVALNQPRLEKVPQVAPSVGPDHAGVVVFGRW